MRITTAPTIKHSKLASIDHNVTDKDDEPIPSVQWAYPNTYMKKVKRNR